jgi:hypothetical protein
VPASPNSPAARQSTYRCKLPVLVAALRFSSRAAAPRRRRVWAAATPIANGTGSHNLAVPMITAAKRHRQVGQIDVGPRGGGRSMSGERCSSSPTNTARPCSPAATLPTNSQAASDLEAELATTSQESTLR